MGYLLCEVVPSGNTKLAFQIETEFTFPFILNIVSIAILTPAVLSALSVTQCYAH